MKLTVENQNTIGVKSDTIDKVKRTLQTVLSLMRDNDYNIFKISMQDVYATEKGYKGRILKRSNFAQYNWENMKEVTTGFAIQFYLQHIVPEQRKGAKTAAPKATKRDDVVFRHIEESTPHQLPPRPQKQLTLSLVPSNEANSEINWAQIKAMTAAQLIAAAYIAQNGSLNLGVAVEVATTQATKIVRVLQEISS